MRSLFAAAVIALVGAASVDHSRLLVYVDDGGNERPVTTPRDWFKRRAQVLVGMQEAMGPLPDRTNLPPLDVRVTEEAKEEGYTRVALSFLAEGTDRVPCHLYLPTNRKPGQRSPAMLALHQTSPNGKRDLGGGAKNPNMGYAPELARRGYVVLCPDYPSFGDYAGYDFAADNYVSGTMKGVFNHMRAVDLLAARNDVDPQKIGVIGHSLGGHNAMFVGAFDERLKVVVSSCGWTPFADYYGGKIAGWTSDRYMPRLRDAYQLDPARVPFDFYEVVAALAPRAFFSSSPVRDDNFAVEGVKKAAAAARPVFELVGAADNLKVIHPDFAHDFPPEVRREAYAFIDKALGHAPPDAADYKSQLPRVPPREPKDALTTFQALPGFTMRLAAAEPLVCSPVACSFDESARLFVVEMRDYSEQDKERLGTVRLLEDTDHDGVFDKGTVYADDLSWPTAILCYDGGVFVGAAPDLYYLKDADGDGKAEQRKVVFTGFERNNVQGLLNSFNWGLDNRVHGSASSSGGKITRPDRPDAKPVDLRGRDFSFDPRTLDLRPESGGAQHGLTFDDWGRKFVCSNSDHVQMVMYEDRYLARNPSVAAPPPRLPIAADGPQAKVFRISPVEPWRVLRTRLRVAGLAPGPIEGGGTPAGYFTSATGITVYRGDAWPEAFRGQVIVGDVGSNLIHRKALEPDGVAFVAKRVDEGKEFVASTDTWFRPVQFANAPDGTLFVLDMYREVIEHPASLPPEIKKHLDLTSGRERGRIYRIVPDGHRRREHADLGALTTPRLVALLEHPNGWHRDTAARLLYERQDVAARAALERLAASSEVPEARVHAMYALAGLKALGPEVVLRRLDDAHPRVREHAVRLSEPFLRDAPDVRSKLAAMVQDAGPRVLYQLAFTLGEAGGGGGGAAGGDERLALASLLAEDANRGWVRFAARTSLSPAAALDALARLIRDGALPESANGFVLTTQLVEQAAGGGPQDVARVLEVLEAVPDPSGATAHAILRGAARGLRPGGPRLTDLLKPGSNGRRALDGLLAKSRAIAAGTEFPPEMRARSAGTLALGPLDEALEALAPLLDNRQPQELQRAALAALDSYAEPRVGAVLVKAWPGLTPAVRTAAADVVFSRPERAGVFLAAVEAGKIPASDVDPARLRVLESSDDADLRDRAGRLLAALKLGKRDDVVAAYRGALELKGDPAKGKATFEKTCAACHRLDGVGHEIGPNLAAMQARGAEAVLVNVLDPNREINPQYVDYIVETTDGRTLTGMLAAETANSVTLRRAENATDTILRSNIKRMRGGRVSIMPEGLEQQIDAQGMADLVAYVMGAK